MKKIICILAGAALLGACEEQSQVAAPPATEKKDDKAVDPNTLSRGAKPALTKEGSATGVKSAEAAAAEAKALEEKVAAQGADAKKAIEEKAAAAKAAAEAATSSPAP